MDAAIGLSDWTTLRRPMSGDRDGPGDEERDGPGRGARDGPGDEERDGSGRGARDGDRDEVTKLLTLSRIRPLRFFAGAGGASSPGCWGVGATEDCPACGGGCVLARSGSEAEREKLQKGAMLEVDIAAVCV